MTRQTEKQSQFCREPIGPGAKTGFMTLGQSITSSSMVYRLSALEKQAQREREAVDVRHINQ